MPTRCSSTGFTLIEMVVVIVVTAILMAMAAPLIVHLVGSYEVSAEGADLASAVGPAVWQIQWDARNSNHLNVPPPGKTSCSLILRQSPSNNKIKYQYDYNTGELFQKLPGATPVLILAHLTVPGGGCPFAVVKGQNNRLATYDMWYQKPGSSGRIAVEGALPAYGRP